jgi:hypothetical protein
LSVKLHLSVVGTPDLVKPGPHFSAPLHRLEWIDGRTYIVVDGFRFYLTGDEAGEFVDVPDGFVTNFASTPPVVWPIFPPTGSYAQAAVVHDKLFLAPVIRSARSARPCAFGETAPIFLAASEACGTSWVTRRVMYRMLQAFSHPEWEKYRAKDRLVMGGVGPVALPGELTRFEVDAVALRKEGRA